MTDDLIVRRDRDFLLKDWLEIDSLLDVETLDAFLDLSEDLAINQFLTHYKQSDRDEPDLGPDGVHVCPPIGQALRKYAELGFFAAGFPEELGGTGLPFLACAASYVYFAAANAATSAYSMLTIANARLITVFGSQAQIQAFALPQIEGRWFGTMCLSEPQAGSSLADIRTRAVPDDEDELGRRFRLFGNKMWISGGDQDISENIIHLVLAKIPDNEGRLPEGTSGISLFIVPKLLPDGSRNDVAVAGLNHKMGYRGTSNCLLNFGESGGATGWLVGHPGQGLSQMFQMMNEARISVGLGAAALGYRGYRLSVRYAGQRVQGRQIGDRSGAPVPIIEHPDVKRMLLAQKCYVEGALALCLYCARLVDLGKTDADAAALLGLLTPVAKTWSSEYGLETNDIAIQIHGGYGYTRDFDVEQLWRDNRLNLIHEGTTGIQGIDLVGRKILRDGTPLLLLEKAVLCCVRETEIDEELKGYSGALSEAWQNLSSATETLRECEGARAFDNATPFLRAFGHVVIAWLWLDQASTARKLAGSSDDADFLKGKLLACRFFFELELPKVDAWLSPVNTKSNVANCTPATVF